MKTFKPTKQDGKINYSTSNIIEVWKSWLSTHCEHDQLTVHGIDPKIVNKEDLKQLSELGFCDLEWRRGWCQKN